MDVLNDKLFRCAALGFHFKLEKLILAGADVNAICDKNYSAHCYEGSTPLIAAASAGKDKCVEILLKYGANPHYVANKERRSDSNYDYSLTLPL